MGPNAHSLWAICQEAFNPVTSEGWEVQVNQLPNEDVQQNGVERHTKIHKNPADVASLFFSVENSGEGVIC